MLTNPIFLAVAGGLFPALLWLWFWLKEDKVNPEPRRLIFLSFILGMLSIFLVFPIEKFVSKYIIAGDPQAIIQASMGLALLGIFLWALIEEIFKILAAYFGGIGRKASDEPVDAVIYAITAALGFAALENILFIFSTYVEFNIFAGALVTNFRFIGATLLHILTTGIIGVFLAFSFYKSRARKIVYFLIGLITATILHTLFNFFIMSNESSGVLIPFGSVWVGIIVLILLFQKVKKIKARRRKKW